MLNLWFILLFCISVIISVSTKELELITKNNMTDLTKNYDLIAVSVLTNDCEECDLWENKMIELQDKQNDLEKQINKTIKFVKIDIDDDKYLELFDIFSYPSVFVLNFKYSYKIDLLNILNRTVDDLFNHIDM